jgi:hypothetical protein
MLEFQSQRSYLYLLLKFYKLLLLLLFTAEMNLENKNSYWVP